MTWLLWSLAMAQPTYHRGGVEERNVQAMRVERRLLGGDLQSAELTLVLLRADEVIE